MASEARSWLSRPVTIRAARQDELELLRTLESAAGVLFRRIGMTDIAEHPPPPLQLFEQARHAGRLWVTVDADDHPTGFVLITRFPLSSTLGFPPASRSCSFVFHTFLPITGMFFLFNVSAMA